MGMTLGLCAESAYGPVWTRREKRSKLGSKLGHVACFNSSIHIARAKQHIMQQASEWDMAPFFRVRFSRRVQCGRGRNLLNGAALTLISALVSVDAGDDLQALGGAYFPGAVHVGRRSAAVPQIRHGV